jgi:hypothetical protein
MNNALARRILSNNFTRLQILFILYLYDRYNAEDIFHKEKQSSTNSGYTWFGLLVNCSYSQTNALYKPLVKSDMLLEAETSGYYRLNPVLIPMRTNNFG